MQDASVLFPYEYQDVGEGGRACCGERVDVLILIKGRIDESTPGLVPYV